MKKFWLFSLFAALFIGLALPTSQASASTKFSDVSDTYRAKDEIYYLVEGGIANGISPTAFSPSMEVTRGQAAAMLGRALGLNGEKRKTSFTDVSENYFASGYIEQLVKKGIISGYPNGQFLPNKTLSRGEMAILINRSFGNNTNSVAVATSTLMKKGIANGYADGSFGEKDTIIRADFAVFLARSINAEFRTAETETFDQIMYVNVNDLNFRTGPNTSYPSIGKYNLGQVVEYAYSIGDWAYVSVNGVKGFVHTAYLQTTVPDPNNPPVVTPPPTQPPTNTPKPLSDLVIVIDPGHGAHDPGASGYGLLEKNVVLDVGKRVKNYFVQSPLQVKMTRETDVFVELRDRVAFAKKNNGHLFISIHANALNGSANGTETYYYTAAKNPYEKESIALAKYLQARAVEAWGLADRKAKYGNYHVLRENAMPASLVEMGFIDNKNDNAYLASPSRREQMAKAIYLGTLDYLYNYENREDVLPLYKQLNATPSPKR